MFKRKEKTAEVHLEPGQGYLILPGALFHYELTFDANEFSDMIATATNWIWPQKKPCFGEGRYVFRDGDWVRP